MRVVKVSEALEHAQRHLERTEAAKRPTLHLRAKAALYPDKMAVESQSVTKPFNHVEATKQTVYERASGLLYKK